MSWNLSLFWSINHFAAHTGWAHGFMPPFALWGGPVLLVVLLVIAWWRRRDQLSSGRATAAAVLTGIGAVVALALNQVAAHLHAERRPFLALHGVTVLLSHSADNSFPSDHAAIAGALAVGILLFAPRWGVFAVLVALFLAFARVYVGVHYPDDVIAGLCIGAVAGLVIVGGLLRPATGWCERLAPAPMRRLVGVSATRPADAGTAASRPPSRSA